MVTVIFKDLDIETLLENAKEYLANVKEKVSNNTFLNKAFKFIKRNRKAVRIACLVAVGVIAFSITTAATGIRVAYNVTYSGEVIAKVANGRVLKSAQTIVNKNINGDDAQNLLSVPKLKISLTVSDKLDNAEVVADAIIKNTDNLVSASRLFINGEEFACAEKDKLEALLEARRTAYYIEGAENKAEFLDVVETKTAYCSKSDLSDEALVNEIVSSLSVETVSNRVVDVAVPFATKKVESASYNVGYSRVTTAGQNGLDRKNETIRNLNGVDVSVVVNSNEVITAPVTQVITVGTAPVKISATEKANAASAGFICPISSGKYVISSYWGDGRNHKGLDLAANRGVAIFAAASGTVVQAGWDGNYGYSVTIDHGNGMKTKYAHCSALCVSVGQTVSQGDMIAAVGSTGYSTGNHLHFEVIVNGTRVNPAPYIGL